MSTSAAEYLRTDRSSASFLMASLSAFRLLSLAMTRAMYWRALGDVSAEKIGVSAPNASARAFATFAPLARMTSTARSSLSFSASKERKPGPSPMAFERPRLRPTATSLADLRVCPTRDAKLPVMTLSDVFETPRECWTNSLSSSGTESDGSRWIAEVASELETSIAKRFRSFLPSDSR